MWYLIRMKLFSAAFSIIFRIVFYLGAWCDGLDYNEYVKLLGITWTENTT